MTLSWNEIKSRAVEFSNEWKDDFNEHAEAKSFMDGFFNVFGISRRRVATFEQNVKKEDGHQGFIDLLWKGNILIEFKSRGKDLDKAHQQAKDYFPGIKESDLPKFILVCDFDRFRLYDLEENTEVEFTLSELVKNVRHFAYLLGYQKKLYKEQDPANIKAAELMGKLHDRLEEIGYTGHPLEVYLVRILFCLFAEDTTIFEKRQFQEFIERRTNEDGSDLASRLQELFQVLNTPKELRFKNLDEDLAAFEYVNGKLFEENLPTASFDAKMRAALLDCCYLDWSKISPAIFGSMFQSVMDPKERRNLGAHYTSETNILKLIKPLFLDELWAEFETVKGNRSKLQEFHKKLASLRFLDPACGCGNFLVITYRELRLLEIEILRALNKSGQQLVDVSGTLWLDVDMMSGIEMEEFPARIAEVAMWLIDHQMNMLVSNEFGQYFVRLPLKKSANIVHGNALRMDWAEVVGSRSSAALFAEELRFSDDASLDDGGSAAGGIAANVDGGDPVKQSFTANRKAEPENQLSYILGNPPFGGARIMSKEQKADLAFAFDNFKGVGDLDFVTGWYIKAASYIQNTGIKVAFVSTNSVTQGEQVGILWSLLFQEYGIKIHFAHRTFKWSNEARGKAAVFCVIIGFAAFDTANKRLFEYESVTSEPHETKVKNINPYLIDALDILIRSRTSPICEVPEIVFGNMANDGGFLLLDDNEKDVLLSLEPVSKNYIRRIYGSEEFINRKNRWCLWLNNVRPDEIRVMPEVMKRVQSVKDYRLASKREATRKLASVPYLFGEIRHPATDYILIPKVSSERRRFIPIGVISNDVIASDLCLMVPNASLFHFGVLTSTMHMAWMRQVCGRLEGRYRYSNKIVYNNFPWPENPSEKQKTAIEEKAQKVLDVRAEFPNSSLADLYDPLTMPPALIKAHAELDKAVDLAYRPQPFTSEAKRMEFLFELYEKYTARLFPSESEKKKKKA